VSAIGLGLAALGRPGYLNVGHGEDLGADRSVAALERRCHSVLDEAYQLSSGVLDDAAVLDELARLRKSGVAVGLTVTGTDQADTIDRALEAAGFDSVQATYNLLERSAEPALERAHAAGLRVMIKEALANGRLTPRGGCTPLEAVAARLGASSDAVAIAAILARPWVDVVLSGASTPEQLESNLAALELSWSGEFEEELAGLAEPSEEYWATRSALPWT
jgi:aryl-alcohol dehydrogenase-like predicted oxidoreductase